MTEEKPVGIPKEKLMPLIAAFNEKPGLNLALFIASSALLNKTTWDGEDYSLHWLQVARVNDDDISIDEKIVGVLHDVVEDSDWTVEDLEAVGFSPRICEAVRRLTKDDNEFYLDAVARCGYDPLARKVKRRDNKHNMDVTRSFSAPTDKQKYLYPISYNYLRALDDVNDPLPVGYPVWKFLQMDKYKGLLFNRDGSINAEAYSVIAANISAPVPENIVREFGVPAGRAKAGKKPAPVMA